MTPTALPTADGAVLTGHLFRPAEPPTLAVQINGAMGVPQRYYARFARWLAEHGVLVLTYDYRTIGASRRGPLRGDPATLLDWVRFDQAAAAQALAEAAGPCPRVVIGHSLGGQMLPLHPHPEQLAAVVLVAAQWGHYRLWSGLGRLRLWLFWFVVLPGAARLLGYLPQGLGLGEAVPGGVVAQWARWGRHPDYLLSELGEAGQRAFAGFAPPRLAVSALDDHFAPPAAIEALLARLPAGTERRVLPTGGHFGFFRATQADTLWPDLLAWLHQTTQPR